MFPSDTGKVVKPLRMALGSRIIQKKFQYSDRELIEQITENPYLQYFIGLPGYQEEPPFDPSTLVLFLKQLDVDAIMDANAIMFDKKDDDKTEDATSGNQGTLIVDATCALANIRYPQDISLLNEAREKLEAIIYRFCKAYALPVPRRYARKTRKDYLAYAKCRRHTTKQTRKAMKKQLSYVRRDLGYMGQFLSEGYVPTKKEILLLLTIMKLYRQQQNMYDNKVHGVPDRIVSIHQPWIRPIVRGKARATTEFGAKLDVSMDAQGYSRIEHVSFDVYNEKQYLKEAVHRYYKQTGHYPEGLLVAQIYHTRENRAFCKQYGIRMSGPKLGRPSKYQQSRNEKKQKYQDNTDRIEIERVQFGEAQLWTGPHNHKAGANSTFVDCVICICRESFQDAEKNSLRFFGVM